MNDNAYPPVAFVSVNDLQIAYRCSGNGPPLVLLHGGMEDSRSWRRQFEGLAGDFTIVAWDAPGCGQSSDPPPAWTLRDYAACLAGFIDAVALDRPHLLGLSWGGGLAIQLCDYAPHLPRSLILVSAYAGWAGSLPPEEVERRVRQALQECELPPEHYAESWIPTLFTPEASEQEIAEVIEIMGDSRSAGMKGMLMAFAASDLRPILPAIDIPTLLVYGAEDVRSPLTVANAIHHRIRESELVVIPGVGHLVNVQAANRFNDEVRSFLHSMTA